MSTGGYVWAASNIPTANTNPRNYKSNDKWMLKHNRLHTAPSHYHYSSILRYFIHCPHWSNIQPPHFMEQFKARFSQNVHFAVQQGAPLSDAQAAEQELVAAGRAGWRSWSAGHLDLTWNLTLNL